MAATIRKRDESYIPLKNYTTMHNLYNGSIRNWVFSVLFSHKNLGFLIMLVFGQIKVFFRIRNRFISEITV